MKTSKKEILFDAAEKLLDALHVNRTVTMAIDFFDQSCSREGIEAVQYTLRHQEMIIEELYKTIEKLNMDENSSVTGGPENPEDKVIFPLNSTFPQKEEESSPQKTKS